MNLFGMFFLGVFCGVVARWLYDMLAQHFRDRNLRRLAYERSWALNLKTFDRRLNASP